MPESEALYRPCSVGHHQGSEGLPGQAYWLHLLQLGGVFSNKSSIADVTDGLIRDEAPVVFAMNGLTRRELNAQQAQVGQACPGTLVF